MTCCAYSEPIPGDRGPAALANHKQGPAPLYFGGTGIPSPKQSQADQSIGRSAGSWPAEMSQLAPSLSPLQPPSEPPYGEFTSLEAPWPGLGLAQCSEGRQSNGLCCDSLTTLLSVVEGPGPSRAPRLFSKASPSGADPHPESTQGSAPPVQIAALPL